MNNSYQEYDMSSLDLLFSVVRIDFHVLNTFRIFIPLYPVSEVGKGESKYRKHSYYSFANS